MLDYLQTPPGASVPAPKPTLTKCPAGHTLVDLGTTEDNGWGCDGQIRPGGCVRGCTGFRQSTGWGRFQCRPCDYDLCDHCFTRDTTPAAPATKTSNKSYLSTHISPVLSYVMKKIAEVRPSKVLDFMITSLLQFQEEESIRKTAAKNGVLFNRKGFPIAYGFGPGPDENKLYCGRTVGCVVHRSSSSDGKCGPSSGPQCSDCQAAHSTPARPFCEKHHPMVLTDFAEFGYKKGYQCNKCGKGRTFTDSMWRWCCFACAARRKRERMPPFLRSSRMAQWWPTLLTTTGKSS